MLAIDCDGNLYPCLRFIQYSLEHRKEIRIGSIDEGLIEDRVRPFLALTLRSQSSDECINCEVAQGCAWCQGHNYDTAETPRKVTKPDGEIEFSHVSFGYSNDRKTIDDISLRVSPRQITALVGSNGAGKSTILYLLLRFYEPDTGLIHYDGIDIGEIDMESWRDLVGAVLQEPFVFGGSIKENLQAVDESLSIEEIVAACKVVGLDQFINNLPKKYDTILGEELNLSTGQKQRLSLARCLLKKTPVILLDEPTSSLDRDAEKSLLDLIKQLSKTHTVIIVTHQPSAIEIADKIVLIEGGRVVGETLTSETLQTADGGVV